MLTVAQKKDSPLQETNIADISFIDCDTHFLPMQALEKLARLHPDFFRFTADKDWVRFTYQGRIIAESRAGGEISGASEHGHLYLEKKGPGYGSRRSPERADSWVRSKHMRHAVSPRHRRRRLSVPK